MPDVRGCLLDSNVLLGLSKSNDPQYENVRQAVRILAGESMRICYTSQTLAEFWNVSTRPTENNGFGLSVDETNQLAQVIERSFEYLPDGADTHARWRGLLVAHQIRGVQVHDVQVHDARLASSMYVHGVEALLTLNTRDFRRFEGLRVFHPSDLTEQNPLRIDKSGSN